MALTAALFPLSAARRRLYDCYMGQIDDHAGDVVRKPSRAGFALLGGGGLALLLAGLLLWWREGDKLFTDGLIATLIACF